MKVLNIHTRKLNKSKSEVAGLLATLSTENDQLWPYEQWPRMKFEKGLAVGSKGGHGPIKYQIEKYVPGEMIRFLFIEPKGFNGFHQFEIRELNSGQTEISHTIDMRTSGKATLLWISVLRHLHDALIEDAFDKIEAMPLSKQASKNRNLWVRVLRKLFSK
jgi:hypothetical protein